MTTGLVGWSRLGIAGLLVWEQPEAEEVFPRTARNAIFGLFFLLSLPKGPGRGGTGDTPAAMQETKRARRKRSREFYQFHHLQQGASETRKTRPSALLCKGETATVGIK